MDPRTSRSYERDPELWNGYVRLLRDVVGIENCAGLGNTERPGLDYTNSNIGLVLRRYYAICPILNLPYAITCRCQGALVADGGPCLPPDRRKPPSPRRT